ncbi:MAG: MFS transporter [Ferroplasma sp.]|uniref:MFS transporter n=1 Tax=Ferroplasma sp. TaxID=2591003 RepID=UPI002814FF6C|nr:MFS transporter [Ferroplasma sp.]WMT51052.1 MAG: MFS transporter [Ferroplasma sp.]
MSQLEVLPEPIKAMNEARYSRFHVTLIFIISIGAFVDLYVIGELGASTFSIIPYFLYTTSAFSYTAAMLFAGSALGVIFIGPLVDKFGRRAMIIIPLLLMTIFSISSIISATPLELNVSRFMLGFATGTYYPSAMAMIGEFMPTKYRGRGISYIWVSFTIGGTVAYLFGYFAYILIGPVPYEWRIVLGSVLVPSVVGLALSFKLPESTRWAIEKKKYSIAAKSVKLATGRMFTDKDMETARNDLFQPKMEKNIRKNYLTYALIIIPITFAVFSFNLITGALATLNPTILSALGIQKASTYLFSALFLFVQVISTLVIARTIDTVGRLRWGVIGGGLETIFSFAVILIYHNPVALIGIFSGIFFFSYIAIPVMNNAGSELFPTEFRGTSSGVVMFGNRIASVVGLLITPILFLGHDVFRLFAVYGIIGLFGTVMVLLGLRGRKIDKRSLEEIQFEMMNKKNNE